LEKPPDNLQVPTAFWSSYWRSRVPDNRDLYTHRDLEHLRDNILPYKSSSSRNSQLSIAAALFLLLIVLFV